MSDLKLIYEQRRTIAKYAKHQEQLEKVCLAQHAMIQKMKSLLTPEQLQQMTELLDAKEGT